MITFDNVSKVYPDGTVAVNKLAITAPAGKITTLVGPSGCGKTTSMRMIKTAKHSDTIKKTLDAVSAELTTDDLISMNAEAATGTNLSDIAKKWLANAGIASN